MKKLLSRYKKLLIILLIIICAFLVSRNYVQFALIEGKSMEPTYHSIQLIMINKYNHQYQRGDIILFHNDSLDATLIKRIVGLPGDTVEIKDHMLYLNNIPYSSYDFLSDLPIDYGHISFAGITETSITLNEDSYFVLGDNLSESKDSRYDNIGCVQSQCIIGKAISFPLFHSR